MSDLENAEKYLQLFQGGENDDLMDTWNNFLKIASIIQLQSIVRQFNLHTKIQRYTKLTKDELINELVKRIGVVNGKLVYKKIAPINLKDKLKNITLYLNNLKKLYKKDKIMFEEQRKILKKNKRKLQKEIITPKLNDLLNEILAYPKYKASKKKITDGGLGGDPLIEQELEFDDTEFKPKTKKIGKLKLAKGGNVVFELKEQDPMTDYDSMKGRHIMPDGTIMRDAEHVGGAYQKGGQRGVPAYNKKFVEKLVRDKLATIDGGDKISQKEINEMVKSTIKQLEEDDKKENKATKKRNVAKKPKGIEKALLQMTKAELRKLAKHYNRDIPIARYTRLSKEDIITELIQLIEVIDNKIYSIDTPHYSGGGFLDYFRNILDKYRYNLSSSSILKKYGNHKIMVLQINRAPIYDSINKALNMLSLGKWDKVRKEFSYDTLYHLSLVATILMEDGKTYKRILIEKNQQINISDKPKIYDDTEFITILTSTKDLTINGMLNNTIEKIGKEHFFTYDAFSWNCQDFIKSILASNNLYTKKIDDFVYQELTDLVKNLPSYVPITSRLITDLASWIGRLSGAGYETTQN